MNQHEAEFEKIQIQLNVLPIRMLDTKDTEALSKRRPSDYTLVATTGVTFAEVKGCGNATRFDFSRIRPAQWVYADLITKSNRSISSGSLIFLNPSGMSFLLKSS